MRCQNLEPRREGRRFVYVRGMKRKVERIGALGLFFPMPGNCVISEQTHWLLLVEQTRSPESGNPCSLTTKSIRFISSGCPVIPRTCRDSSSLVECFPCAVRRKTLKKA